MILVGQPGEVSGSARRPGWRPPRWASLSGLPLSSDSISASSSAWPSSVSARARERAGALGGREHRSSARPNAARRRPRHGPHPRAAPGPRPRWGGRWPDRRLDVRRWLPVPLAAVQSLVRRRAEGEVKAARGLGEGVRQGAAAVMAEGSRSEGELDGAGASSSSRDGVAGSHACGGASTPAMITSPQRAPRRGSSRARSRRHQLPQVGPSGALRRSMCLSPLSRMRAAPARVGLHPAVRRRPRRWKMSPARMASMPQLEVRWSRQLERRHQRGDTSGCPGPSSTATSDSTTISPRPPGTRCAPRPPSRLVAGQDCEGPVDAELLLLGWAG